MIFLSYARRDEPATRRLYEDLKQLDPWYDERISGGQTWWDEILKRIRECELFVFVLSPESVDSKACAAELEYAESLGRPVLPIRVQKVSEGVTPGSIKTVEIVDVADDPRDNLNMVLIALRELPTDRALPEPLPVPPSIPITDLGPIRERLSATELSLEEQQKLADEIGRHAGDVDLQPTVLSLLNQFRNRHDLFAQVAAEISGVVTRATRPKLNAAEASRRADLIESVATSLRNDEPVGSFTPILGHGLMNTLIGTRGELAHWLADKNDFPFESHRRNDLAVVAQFVSVMSSPTTLRSQLAEYVRLRLQPLTGAHPSNADGRIAEMLKAAWSSRAEQSPTDAHHLFADLPCPIFVTANPWGLLTDSLIERGKKPEVELCCWKEEVYDWPKSVFERDLTYRPTIERPLVYHMFGALDVPESLVITEDDYLDFMMAVTRNSSLLPMPVQSALANSALLLLGFDLDDFDVRVLLKLVASQKGAFRLKKYKHVAAQVDPSSGVVSRDRAHQYLGENFGKSEPRIDIYWGTVDEFTAELAAARVRKP